MLKPTIYSLFCQAARSLILHMNKALFFPFFLSFNFEKTTARKTHKLETNMSVAQI